jgi:hypothetical protein
MSKWIYSCFWQLNFYVNQKEIIRLECENKNRPELKCNGKCYLAKQLKKADENLDMKKSQSENSVKFFKSLQGQFFVATENLEWEWIRLSKKVKFNIFYSENTSLEHLVSVFHPPC